MLEGLAWVIRWAFIWADSAGRINRPWESSKQLGTKIIGYRTEQTKKRDAKRTEQKKKSSGEETRREKWRVECTHPGPCPGLFQCWYGTPCRAQIGPAGCALELPGSLCSYWGHSADGSSTSWGLPYLSPHDTSLYKLPKPVSHIIK